MVEDYKPTNKKYIKKHRLKLNFKRATNSSIANVKKYIAMLNPCFDKKEFNKKQKLKKLEEEKQIKELKKKVDKAAADQINDYQFKARTNKSSKNIPKVPIKKETNDFDLNLNLKLIEDTFKRINK